MDQVKTYKTVNEVRKEKDMEPIEGGDTLLDPVFAQGKMGEAGGMGEGESEDPYGDMVDESFDDIFKAKKLEPRTMLLK